MFSPSIPCTVEVTTFHNIIRDELTYKCMVRILHLFSMAGVAEIMCKYGAGEKVLQIDSLDAFGFAEHYGVTQRFTDINSLIAEALRVESIYDYIVIHDFPEFAMHFAPAKVILVFHGSKLRGMSKREIDAYLQYPCYITTQDLYDCMPFAKMLPNPVDRELFPNLKHASSKVKYLCINRENGREEIEHTIRRRYPDVEYTVRTSKDFVKYADMPQYLLSYTDYVDWKFDYTHPPKTIHAASCTGLQALSLGLRVHDSNGYLLDRNLLIVHDAKMVAEMFLKSLDKK